MDNDEKNSPPLDTVRDRALKATIWKNEGERGPYLSITFAKTYEDRDGNLRDGNRFSPDEALRISELARRAFARAQELGRELKQSLAPENREPAPRNDRPDTGRPRYGRARSTEARVEQGRSRRNGPEQGY